MTKKYKIDSDKAPSELFLNSLQGCGNPDIECSCGRRHYCPMYYDNNDDMCVSPDDGFRKDAENDKKSDPDGVILEYEYDAIIGREIDGKLFVEGCPCNGLTKYENWIWGNRDMIRRYLVSRIEQENQWIQEELLKNKLMGKEMIISERKIY